MDTKKKHHNALAAGYKLHWYVIKEVLGRGGFGITYLADDTNLDRTVAIKEFLPVELCFRDKTDSVNPMDYEDEVQYRWGLERFIAEAKTLARFEHPNIVRVIAVFEENNTGYMVMNYEEGIELQGYLTQKGTLEEGELLNIVVSLLDGLELVHKAGFIHRDIKPQNIMLRNDGTPVLIDFGSARQALGGKTKTLTSLVSPGYAPFEQYYSKSDKQGPWTDIYALAATLYRCIAGRAPLTAVDRSEAIVHGSGDIFVSAQEIGKGKYSENFLKAIDHGLKFKPQERPQSITEWRYDFRGEKPPKRTFLTRPEDVPTEKAFSQQLREDLADTAPAPRRKSGKRLVKVLATVSVVFILAAGAWFYSGPVVDRFMSPDSATQTTMDATVPSKIKDGEQVAELLAAAQRALQEQRYVTPEQDNAWHYYKQVLDRDPTNSAALEGKSKILYGLLEQYRAASDAGNYGIADQKLGNAARVDPDSELIRLARKELDAAIAANEAQRAEAERQRLAEEEAAKRQMQVKSLLDKAAVAMTAKRHIKPEADNARFFYGKVLELDPDNETAREGLRTIANGLVEKAINAINGGDLLNAMRYIEDAENTAPDDDYVSRIKKELDEKIRVVKQAEEARLQKLAETEARKEEITSLLAAARKDMAALRLTSPADQNAYDKYQQVLKLSPANAEALQGIQQIVNSYTTLARDAYNAGDIDKAQENLRKLKSIAPGNENIAQLEQDIRSAARQENRQEQQAQQEEQRRLEEERRRLEEERQRLAQEEEQRRKAAEEEAARQKQLEQQQQQQQQQQALERAKTVNVVFSDIKGKYQSMGLSPASLMGNMKTYLLNAGFNVTDGGNPSDTELSLDFNTSETPGGRLVKWVAKVDVTYKGKTVWSAQDQLEGDKRSLYGVEVEQEAIDDLRPAYDSIMNMVSQFIINHKNNWPP